MRKTLYLKRFSIPRELNNEQARSEVRFTELALTIEWQRLIVIQTEAKWLGDFTLLEVVCILVVEFPFA